MTIRRKGFIVSLTYLKINQYYYIHVTALGEKREMEVEPD